MTPHHSTRNTTVRRRARRPAPARSVPVFGAVAIAALALAACGAPQRTATLAAKASKPPDPACGPHDPTLTVTGQGRSIGTPDLLTLSVGVQTTAGSAQGALGQNNTEATGVITVLKQSGVAAADLQTTGLSINPTYDKYGNIDGYSVSDMVVAKLRDPTGAFSSAGTVIDNVAAQAGNDIRVDGIFFSVDDTSGLQGQARAAAVKDAQGLASAMAAASGESLAGICTMSDTTQVQTFPDQRDLMYAANAAASSPAMASVPVQAGSQEVDAQAQLVWAIAPFPARSGPA